MKASGRCYSRIHLSLEEYHCYNILIRLSYLSCYLVDQFADNKELQNEWKQAKVARKEKLAAYIKAKTGYTINPDALFDIQVRITLSNIPFMDGDASD